MRKNLLLLFLLPSLFSFAQTNLKCITFGNPQTLAEYNNIGYYFNNSPVEYNGCQAVPAIIVAVIDSNCVVMDNCNRNFGQANIFVPTIGCNGAGSGTCRNRAENYFIYKFDSVSMDSLSAFINRVPDKSYILAYTWFTTLYSNYPTFISTFQTLGATQITTLPDTNPYIFFVEKGDPSSVIELVGTYQSDTLTLNTTLNCLYTGIEEFYSDGKFAIYPNPSNGIFTVPSGLEGRKWTMVDIQGRVVSGGSVNQGKVVTDNLSSGLYILSIDELKYSGILISVQND